MAAGPGGAVRAVCSWAILLAAVAAVLSHRAGHAQEPGNVEGGRLYAANCAVCHGNDGQGRTGDGPDASPPVADLDVAYVDMTMRTGRMPIVDPSVGIVADPDLDDDEREAILEWMVAAFDLPGSVPEVGAGDLGRGADLYARHCAACHGATGAGGISADGTLIKAVKGVDRVAVVEAIRTGPFRMPVFEERVIDDDEAADIAAFVEYLTEAPATPLGLVEIDRVVMTGLVVVLVAASLAVMLLTSRRAPFQPPDDEEDPQPQERAGG